MNDFDWIKECNPYHPHIDAKDSGQWAKHLSRRSKKHLLKIDKVLVVTDKFSPCTIRGYRVKQVYVTKELWDIHGKDIYPSLYPNVNNIILYE